MLLALIAAASLAPSWTLVAGGDLMLNSVKVGSEPLGAAKTLFREADVAYLNVEIPLTDATTRTPHKSAEDIRARRQFVLKADPDHDAHLRNAGIDFASLANNHAMDYGVKGLEQTLERLRGAGIAVSGAGMTLAEAESPAVVTAPDGTRVAMVSYLGFVSSGALQACGPAGPSTPGIATLNFGGTIGASAKARLGEIVKRARAKGDLVIAALHWGIEREPVPRAYQVQLGRAFVDAGADLVIGNHPHVLQGSEIYRGKPILYSLGDLINPLGNKAWVAELGYDGAEFRTLTIHPFGRRSGKIVELSEAGLKAAQAEVAELNRKLSRAYPVP